jgi:putative transposase
MNLLPNKYRRNSLRLKGFDYSQPAEYFVTICTRHKVCSLGRVEGSSVILTPSGHIVEETWRWLRDHHDHVELGDFAVMPNHFHGILIIKESCRGGSRTAPTERRKVKGLGRLIGAFKTVSTKRINKINNTPGAIFWQRNFYDHIIRDDVDYFFVEQYIRLNPILWHFDVNHPSTQPGSVDELRIELKNTHGLDDYAIERVIEHELSYRDWYFIETGETTNP